MDAQRATEQIAHIRRQIEGGADGGILDSNTLHGLLFHAERGLKMAAEIERLRTTLATVRLFIEDNMIAHAVVVLEGKDARDPSNPSLLKLIDEALGDEQ